MKKLIIAFCFITFSVGLLLAQTNGTTLPPLPTDTAGYWDLLIAGLSPLIVWGVRKTIPSIPTVLLPSMTPFIGMGLAWVLNAMGAHHFSWWDAAKAGMLAVFVRETFNQAITKRMGKKAVDSNSTP